LDIVVINKNIDLKEYFKDFVYAPETIMVRDRYLTAIPRSENAAL
jgi:hypothetical protein